MLHTIDGLVIYILTVFTNVALLFFILYTKQKNPVVPVLFTVLFMCTKIVLFYSTNYTGLFYVDWVNSTKIIKLDLKKIVGYNCF